MSRVAHFLGTMRPEHDGVTRVVYRLREMFSPQVASHLYVSPIGPEQAQPDIRIVPSIPFPFSTQYRLSTVGVGSVRQVLGNDLPDIVHVHTPDILGAAAFNYARAQNIPAVATYHTHFPSYARYYHVSFLLPYAGRFLKNLYRDCRAVIVPSQATLEELATYGVPNLVHIPHGVDTSRFSPEHRDPAWRKAVAGDEDRVIVAFVSRLVWEKNPMVLVRAWPLLQHPDRVKLVIVGDGPARGRLEKLLPHAHFTGKLGGQSLYTAYASSDIFVFPSITETFGNVTVEAMASGLPAICASAGGARDLVRPGENGFLFDASRPAELAAAIDRLAADANLRAQFSRAALQSAGRFRWEDTVAAYERLYLELME